MHDDDIERILVVTAHPDDVDFGAAGSVGRWTDAAIEVAYCIVTDGEAGGRHSGIGPSELAELRRVEQDAGPRTHRPTRARMGRDDGRAGGACTRAPGGGLPARRLAMTRPTAVSRLLLVRHGESTWNADGRWQGQADPPLSPLGERQARAASETCPDVDAVVSSDLRRAHQTATIIAQRRGLGPVHTERRLRETFTGEWT